LAGGDNDTNDVYMQLAGSGLRMSRAALGDAIERSTVFSDTLFRYAKVLLVQISQTSACNARHALEHRLAR